MEQDGRKIPVSERSFICAGGLAGRGADTLFFCARMGSTLKKDKNEEKSRWRNVAEKENVALSGFFSFPRMTSMENNSNKKTEIKKRQTQTC